MAGKSTRETPCLKSLGESNLCHDFSSHNAWGTDHFGFLYRGGLEKFCVELRGKGVSFPVELKTGVNGAKVSRLRPNSLRVGTGKLFLA
jgi:hypothetical protein